MVRHTREAELGAQMSFAGWLTHCGRGGEKTGLLLSAGCGLGTPVLDSVLDCFVMFPSLLDALSQCLSS